MLSYSNGNVGIGTPSPNYKLDVTGTFRASATSTFSGNVGIGTTGPGNLLELSSSGTAVLELSGNPSSGNNYGEIIFGDPDTNFAARIASLFYTGGIDTGAITFETRNAIGLDERVRIDRDGNVGIGRTPSTNKLEVEGDASKTTAGGWLANSDLFIKEDIVAVDGLGLLSQLNPVAFRYTDEYRSLHPDIADRAYYNFVAQEFAEVFPDFVKGSGEFLANGHEILQLDPYPAQVAAIKAIQEQQKQIEELKAENETLKKRIEALETR